MAEIFRNDGTTPVCADWLNGVDDTVNDALGGAETPSEARQNIGAIGEAPSDSAVYGRQNGTWVVVSTGGGTPVGDYIYRVPPSATVNKITTASNPTFLPLEIQVDSAQTANALTVSKLNDSDPLVQITKSGALIVGPYSALDPTPTAPVPAFTAGEGVVGIVGAAARTIKVGTQGLLRVNPDNNSRGIGIFMDAAPATNQDALSVWAWSGSAFYETVQIQGDGSIITGSSNDTTGTITLETKGTSSARIAVTRKTAGSTNMFLLEKGTVLSDNPIYLRYWANKATNHFEARESVFELTRKPSTRSGAEFPFAQLYSRVGSSGFNGCLSLAHAYTASGAIDGTWTIAPGEINATNQALYFWYNGGIASGQAPAGSPPLKLKSTGDVTITGTYYQVSDARAKGQIVDAPAALSKVRQLQVRSYTSLLRGNRPETGLISDELKAVYPDLVIDPEPGTYPAGNPDYYYAAVSYVGMVPYLIKAVQELAHDLDTLRAGSPAHS